MHKIPAFILSVTISGQILSQRIAIDSRLCPTDTSLYYYSVQAKYPRSSLSLAGSANQYLTARLIDAKGNGYITIRCTIDCNGEATITEILEVDEAYKSCIFDKQLHDSLVDYFKTLHDWKKAKHKGNPINYYAYLSFKIQDGKVVNVIP